MANLIVCADGTWQNAGGPKDGPERVSNVAKLYSALAGADGDGEAQQAYYHPGVGTSGNRLRRLWDGATGEGLDRNIMSGYRWLGGIYRPGDRIFMFGFSRGAYTVRSLAGMIAGFGLADLTGVDEPEVWERVGRIFRQYRLAPEQRSRVTDFAFFNTAAGMPSEGTVPVHFLGVWDTVGALGIPEDLGLIGILGLADRFRGKRSFHDTQLSEYVLHGRHGLAIDEERRSFTPTLWTATGGRADVSQVWFPGVHGDVGGGVAGAGLSDIALRWMIEEAQTQGLAFRPGGLDQVGTGDPRGPVHDSVKGFFRRLQTRPRSVPDVGSSSDSGLFHASVADRRADPPLAQPAYWPRRRFGPEGSIRLRIYAAEQWNRTGIWLNSGEAYRFSAHGEWLDSSVRAGPEGTGGGRFNLQKAGHLLSNGIGVAERLWRRVSGRQRSQFALTRRADDLPWMALVGVVANGPGAVDENAIIPHQRFLIGDGSAWEAEPFRPQASGYLYAWANDAWQFYGNNRGSVELTVTRVPPPER